MVSLRRKSTAAARCKDSWGRFQWQILLNLVQATSTPAPPKNKSSLGLCKITVFPAWTDSVMHPEHLNISRDGHRITHHRVLKAHPGLKFEYSLSNVQKKSLTKKNFSKRRIRRLTKPINTATLSLQGRHLRQWI